MEGRDVFDWWPPRDSTGMGDPKREMFRGILEVMTYAMRNDSQPIRQL